MKYKDETPGNLGGLSDVLSAEVLKMINELLEQLQRAGHINNGSKIELVYVAPGAQHVETQVIASPCPETLPSPFPSKARLPVAFPEREGRLNTVRRRKCLDSPPIREGQGGGYPLATAS